MKTKFTLDKSLLFFFYALTLRICAVPWGFLCTVGFFSCNAFRDSASLSLALALARSLSLALALALALSLSLSLSLSRARSLSLSLQRELSLGSRS
jgi:gamma-glutamylcysteine synthetase